MRVRIASPADLVSGLMFAAIGIGALVIGSDYPIGTMRRMGPGMLPLLLGALLTAVGLGLSIQSLLMSREDGAEIEVVGLQSLRAAFFVTASLIVFALMIRQAGLFLSTIAMVLIATRAERGYPVLMAAIVAIALAGITALIFVYALGLPFRLWPRF